MKINVVVNSFYEACPQGIMVIERNLRSKIMNTTTVIPRRRMSKKQLVIVYTPLYKKSLLDQ